MTYTVMQHMHQCLISINLSYKSRFRDNRRNKMLIICRESFQCTKPAFMPVLKYPKFRRETELNSELNIGQNCFDTDRIKLSDTLEIQYQVYAVKPFSALYRFILRAFPQTLN
jgi:hypothetical protein